MQNDNVIDEYKSKFATAQPSDWFVPIIKTVNNKNITLEDWNTLQTYFSNLSKENNALVELVAEYVGIQDGSITTEKLANKAVTTEKIANGAIDYNKLGVNSVITSAIMANAVTSEKIDNVAVQTRHIKDGNVTTAKIADEAIIINKLSQSLQNTINALGFSNGQFNLSSADVILDDDESLGSILSGIDDDLASINDVIPNDASLSNQLADKNFVNSSIATATATFKGTYTSTSQLPLVNVDNNDYAFISGTDSLGNTYYSRYKYTTSVGWVFEYKLNNSSFTSSQWNAINSGITSILVQKLQNLSETQSDWDQDDDTLLDYIKNKPDIIAVPNAATMSVSWLFTKAKITSENPKKVILCYDAEITRYYLIEALLESSNRTIQALDLKAGKIIIYSESVNDASYVLHSVLVGAAPGTTIKKMFTEAEIAALESDTTQLIDFMEANLYGNSFPVLINHLNKDYYRKINTYGLDTTKTYSLLNGAETIYFPKIMYYNQDSRWEIHYGGSGTPIIPVTPGVHQVQRDTQVYNNTMLLDVYVEADSDHSGEYILYYNLVQDYNIVKDFAYLPRKVSDIEVDIADLKNQLGGSGTLFIKPKLKQSRFANEWENVTWQGVSTSWYGYNVWSDGENTYITVQLPSSSYKSYKLVKGTLTWEEVTWGEYYPGYVSYIQCAGLDVWTDGDNIYASGGSISWLYHKDSNSWETITFTGLSIIFGRNIWTDGINVYYSNMSNDYILDKQTRTWTLLSGNDAFSGLSGHASGKYIWSDGKNIYYSNGSTQVKLNVSTRTWSAKTWTGLTNPDGDGIWTDGTNIYNTESGVTYVLDVGTSTWTLVSFTNGPTEAEDIWSDGANVYYSNGTSSIYTKLKENPLHNNTPNPTSK